MKYDIMEVRKALFAADKCILKKLDDPSSVIQILSPYFDCDGFLGVTKDEGVIDVPHEKLEDIRSMIFAVMADAYKETECYSEAAEWYMKASRISSGGHAALYADMVCKHQLTDYYADALLTLEDSRRKWKNRPLATRVYFRIVAWRSWFYKDFRKILSEEDVVLKFLQKEVDKGL